MIEAALILSALVRHWPDFFIILVLLLANAVVGFWEEHQAGKAIAALKSRLAAQARVRRDGKWSTAPARELVPGDIIRVRLGDIIPADARLLGDDPVEVDQSALTGESLPVTRKAGETVYSGSIIRQGEVDALVYGTGGNTYFGKTAQLVQEAHTVSHFQRAVLKIGDYLIVIAIALVLLILAVALFRGDRMTTTLQFALILTVAAIPVAMRSVSRVQRRTRSSSAPPLRRVRRIRTPSISPYLAARRTITLSRITGPPASCPSTPCTNERRPPALYPA
jgi:H+-transporting ATPase